jgi:hypothetical protein
MKQGRFFQLVLVAFGLMACAPALDWRDVRVSEGQVTALFPCKPDQHARTVRLGSQSVRLSLYACTAAGSTWGLAVADVLDPALVENALAELRRSAMKNLDATQARPMKLQIVGATPNAQSARIEIHGRLPDGRAVTEQVALFAKGTQVFQVTALGEKLAADAADVFFEGLRAGP